MNIGDIDFYQRRVESVAPRGIGNIVIDGRAYLAEPSEPSGRMTAVANHDPREDEQADRATRK